jgi:hypothetical protein
MAKPHDLLLKLGAMDRVLADMLDEDGGEETVIEMPWLGSQEGEVEHRFPHEVRGLLRSCDLLRVTIKGQFSWHRFEHSTMTIVFELG